MFRLRKWYFDFLTPDGEYAYVYFAYITLAGRTLRSLTVHVARPGGSPVTRSFLLDRHEEHGAGMTDCTRTPREQARRRRLSRSLRGGRAASSGRLSRSGTR